MQDEFLPAATISPSPATCVPATASPAYTPPGGPAYPAPFYNALAWCACGDNHLYPLLPQATPQFADSASARSCAYTIPPSSTITASALSSTSCKPTTKYPLTTIFCECSGDGTSILYPTGTQGCVFSSVPTPLSLPSFDGEPCDQPCPGTSWYTCDFDEKTIVSRNSRTEIRVGNADGSLFSKLECNQNQLHPSIIVAEYCAAGYKCTNPFWSPMLSKQPPICVPV